MLALVLQPACKRVCTLSAHPVHRVGLGDTPVSFLCGSDFFSVSAFSKKKRRTQKERKKLTMDLRP